MKRSKIILIFYDIKQTFDYYCVRSYNHEYGQALEFVLFACLSLIQWSTWAWENSDKYLLDKGF